MVLVPTTPVPLNGSPSIAWLEINLAIGDAIAVAEDGTHGAADTALAYVVVADLAAAGATATTEVAAVTAAEDAGLVGGGLIRQAASDAAGKLVGLARKQFIVREIRQYANTVIGQLLVSSATGALPLYGRFALEFRQLFGAAFQAGIQKLVEGVLRQDPEVPTVLGGETPNPGLGSTDTESVAAAARLSAGAITAALATPSIQATGALVSTWTTPAGSGFEIDTLSANATNVSDANGQTVGTGLVAIALSSPIAASISPSISGNIQYTVDGNGELAFYGPAESDLGVSGDWTDYAAMISGNASITLTTDSLMLNGTLLPAGTYVITTAMAALAGSGHSTSPNFSGSVSIGATALMSIGAPAPATSPSGEAPSIPPAASRSPTTRAT